jgi:hypothetical protein
MQFLGRYKEMLKVGGENVSPAALEQELVALVPSIEQVAVVGVADRRLLEVPCAYVVPKSGMKCSLDDVQSRCKGKIASFKIPRYVVSVESLPMTGSGKVQRVVLRERANRELGPGSNPDASQEKRRATVPVEAPPQSERVWTSSSMRASRGVFRKKVQWCSACRAKDLFANQAVPMVFGTVGHPPGMEAAGEKLEIIFFGHSYGAVHSVSNRGDLGHSLARTGLGDCCAQQNRNGSTGRKGARRCHTRGCDMFRHEGELVLDRLKLADRASELAAVVGVLQREFEAARQGTAQERRMKCGAPRRKAPGWHRAAQRSTPIFRRGPAQVRRHVAVDADSPAVSGARIHQLEFPIQLAEDDICQYPERRPEGEKSTTFLSHEGGCKCRKAGGHWSARGQQRPQRDRLADRERNGVGA